MDAEALRALQAPLKSRYRDEPNAALITLRAEGHVDDANIACKVETGRALVPPGCTRRPAAPAWRPAPATCFWRRWSPAPA